MFAWSVPASADEVHRQLFGEPESLDPQLISGSTDFDLAEDLFEGLTAQGADGSVVPGLADRWVVSADRLTWTFHLRPNLVWSDGTPLGADDLVWAMRRGADPRAASPYAATLGPLRNADAIIAGTAKPETLGVTATDDRTVTIALKEPTPFLPALMSLPVTYPLPRAVIERWGKDWTQPGHIVSDGAFTLAAWTPEAELLLARNPRYYDADAVKLARVHWLVAADRKAALRRYRAGEIDAVALAADDYGWAIQNRAGELRSVSLLALRQLNANLKRGPLSGDVRLRQALSLVIDRERLVSTIDTRGQRAAWSIVPPGLEGYAPQTSPDQQTPLAERQAHAKALWAAVRGDKAAPLAITLVVERDDVDHRLASALRAMWMESLPVIVNLEETEWRVYNAAVQHGDFDLALTSWYADYADPWTFLANYRSDAGPLNPGGYRSPTYDAALDTARNRDGAARMESLEAAERVLLGDAAVIPVEYVVSQKLVNPKLRGWEADPFDMNRSRYLSLTP